MDVLSFAGHVDVSEAGKHIAGIEGPFADRPFGGQAVLVLRNGYRLSMIMGPMNDPGFVEVAVLRDVTGHPDNKETVFDYRTPVTHYAKPNQSVEDVIQHVKTLSALVNDPSDHAER